MKYQRGWVEVEGAKGRKRYVGRYRADDGTKPKVNLGFVAEMTLSEARAKLEANVRELGSRPQSSRHVTFDQYYEQHYKPVKRVGWGPPTERGYDHYMSAYLSPAFGNTRIIDIEPEQIARFFTKMCSKHERSVVQKMRTLLNAILEHAIDNELLARNPMRKVGKLKTKLPNKPVIEKSLLARVLEEVKGDACKSAILHVGCFCAMRPSEVFGLEVGIVL